METQHEVEQRQINTYLFGNYAAVSNSEVINLCSGKQPRAAHPTQGSFHIVCV